MSQQQKRQAATIHPSQRPVVLALTYFFRFGSSMTPISFLCATISIVDPFVMRPIPSTAYFLLNSISFAAIVGSRAEPTAKKCGRVTTI